MGIPEIALQKIVTLSWKFVQQHTYMFGQDLDDFEPMKQERYRRMVEEEQVTINFGYPLTDTVLPAFSIVLLAEEEEIEVIGDEGVDTRALPFPPVAPEDYYPQEEFYGATYGQTDQPQFDGVDGDWVRESTRHPLPQKNLAVQRAPGDEQYEQLNHPQRLYHRDQQKVSARAVMDRVNMGIFVTCATQEQTIVYHRLLRNVLRRFMGLMNTNKIQNPKFSSSDLTPAEALGPSTGGTPPFQRMLTISFQYEDRYLDIEAVIRGWVLEVNFVTPREDGGQDSLNVVKVTSDEDIE